MNTDLALVVGVVLAILSVPAMVSALSDARAPRAAAITVMIAGAMIVWAVTQKPGGYAVAEVPDVFVRVLAPLFR
ncbi:hypothetical protein [Roseovarius salinarum]|uniref:hypothetical protein n=1 Tax=Roseovarius salinarum TaxID=1981892 RepID=UPI000C34364B|nr:hypothetical protein [Roseovarius salinarum]